MYDNPCTIIIPPPVRMSQDTGKFRTNTKDQYYTKESVAKTLVLLTLQTLPETAQYQWIEPSAGTGAFLKALPSGTDALAIDLDPKAPGIVKGDFLLWEPTVEKKRIVFGNPPFGRQGSLAKKFIQHASSFADVISFILPRSFVKPSMSRAFPRMFHCLISQELEAHSFEVNGREYDVPCVFQIWQKQATHRPLEEAVEEEGFSYVKQKESFDFAIKRVGGLAGKAVVGKAEDFNPQYHYYIRLDKKNNISTIVKALNEHIFPSNTTGPRSLSKSEINEVLNPLVASCS